MSSDQSWYESFAELGEEGLFGRDVAAADTGIFGRTPPPSPTVPSTSPLTARFGDNIDESYLRIDLWARTINNTKYAFTEWHRVLKKLLPGELLTIRQFKWVSGGGVFGPDRPANDDIGKAIDFPKSTLQWLIHKFIHSEGARSVLRVIEFSGKFSPKILGTLGDDDQSELIQFIAYAHKLTHLRIGHVLTPPTYRDDDCALLSDDDEPAVQYDRHWHVPLVFGIQGKPLQQLELRLGHFDAKSLGDLLSVSVDGELKRLSIQFEPVHANLQLGEFMHTMAACSLRNLTHLAIGLPSSVYNATGRLPRFFPGEDNTPKPEDAPIYVGAQHDTYFTANMFDCALDLKLFSVNFGEHRIEHPRLNHLFGPDMRRFLACQASRPDEVLVRFEGVRLVGCQFTTFMQYLHGKIERLQVTTCADEVSVSNMSATVTFKVTDPRNCSTDTFENNLCRACRSLYPVVLHTIALLALEYHNRHNVLELSTEYEVQDCVLEDLTKDLNSCNTRQSWVWDCLPDIELRANRRSAVFFKYANTDRIMGLTFRNTRCDLARNCPRCFVIYMMF